MIIQDSLKFEIIKYPSTGKGRDKQNEVLEHSSAIKKNEALNILQNENTSKTLC